MPYKLLTQFCKHSILATGLTQPKHIPLTTSQLQPCKTLWHETGRNIWQKGPCCMAERHILQHETVNIGTHSLACKNLLSDITPLLCTVKSVTMTANAKEALHSAKPESSIQLQNAQQLDESQNLSNEKSRRATACKPVARRHQHLHICRDQAQWPLNLHIRNTTNMYRHIGNVPRSCALRADCASAQGVVNPHNPYP